MNPEMLEISAIEPEAIVGTVFMVKLVLSCNYMCIKYLYARNFFPPSYRIFGGHRISGFYI